MIQRLSFWIMMIVCSVMVSGQEYDGYYTNPILPSGADPWVVKHEGWYYYCCGVLGGIGVSRSRDLHKINPPVRVWKAPEKGQWNSTCIWAPELHFWKGKWYIFYAGGYSGQNSATSLYRKNGESLDNGFRKSKNIVAGPLL